MAIFRNKNQAPVAPGRFIVIDGPDGTGKATQTDLLAQTLAAEGYNGVIMDFPQYNTASAALLEKYLAGEYGQLNPKAASVLYAIDRFDASSKIRQHLAEGKIVLANRYVTSNAGHQGAKISDYAKRVSFYKWLENLEYVSFNIPKPDLNIILHMPAEISWELIQERALREGRKADLYESDPEHLQAAERTYVEIANLFPNSKLVECYEQGDLLTPKKINAKVWALVRRIALKDLPPASQD
jgi:dTMP kinase